MDIVESFRKTELRLRLLLFGDGALTPPLVKGEVQRQRVTSEMKHLRAAFDRLVERERASRSEFADAARALERELTDQAARHVEAQREAERAPLVTAAEAAKVLGMSSSAVYRAIRNGTIEAASSAGAPIRVSSAEVLRLLAERRVESRPT